MQQKRRQFLKSTALAGSLAVFPQFVSATTPHKKARVIVIGGGFSGATAAKYLAMWSTDIEIILIEKNAVFVSCPQSNLVLSGTRTLQQLTHDYHGLKDYGIQLVQATVNAVDAEHRSVVLDDGTRLKYDRLIVAPGVDFIYDNLPMLTPQLVSEKIPHAWKAGEQTALLRRQLEAMPDGGKVVMTIPAAPFKCPPGPYERACQIALYLKRSKPKSKLIILDANGDIISKKALFKHSWEQLYSGLIDYYPSNAIESVDVNSLTVESVFDSVSADVLNVIPPQKAGKVAELAGVINVDNRWCEVDFRSYESTQVSHIHVIGDAVASKLPKSGHIANAQAKVCAAAIIDLLHDQQPEQTPVFGNTCYSFVSDQLAGHVAAVFRYDAQQHNMIAMPGGGASTEGSEPEVAFADAWANNIWSDILN